MKYLLDTNIWLEALLKQEKSEEVVRFLDKYSGDVLVISDFSLHSILIILTRFKEFEVADMFLDDIIDSAIEIISVKPDRLKEVLKIIETYNVNFDDAYQYHIAKNHNLILVSSDKDFDKTGILRKTPEDLI
ncbi:PIN domain-containing protein [Persephonella atlantica]|uniref:Ribonuclease VapC n=1 Tax=Persephonella atlantica TaxID=2699429 RepID=A0ABS1GJT2_9AQUI|nr:PIN domain-containing protein [Persephonella atlantica]